MHRGSYYDSVFAIETKKSQVCFFFAMLVSLYDVISWDVMNVINFRETLRYFF